MSHALRIDQPALDSLVTHTMPWILRCSALLRRMGNTCTHAHTCCLPVAKDVPGSARYVYAPLLPGLCLAGSHSPSYNCTLAVHADKPLLMGAVEWLTSPSQTG